MSAVDIDAKRFSSDRQGCRKMAIVLCDVFGKSWRRGWKAIPDIPPWAEAISSLSAARVGFGSLSTMSPWLELTLAQLFSRLIWCRSERGEQ